VLAFDEVFELSALALTVFLVNLQVRFHLHSPLQGKNSNDSVFWYEALLEALNMAILLLVVVLFKLEMNCNECSGLKKKLSSPIYEDEKEGILNCDSFEKYMGTQKILESLRGATFIVA
jgi:hypothetical protein